MATVDRWLLPDGIEEVLPPEAARGTFVPPTIIEIGAIADLVAPRTCAGCGVRGEALCAACRTELRGSPLRVRLRADVPVPVFACGRYGGASQAVINAYKEIMAMPI